jgi:serine/threonine-protein kinase RsbW
MASAWLEAAAIEQRVPREQITRLDQCLTEALANVIVHGGPAARSSPVCLRLEAHIEPGSCQAAVTVSDGGIAFDPLAYERKPGPQTLAEAEPGGLGLVMMRGFSDNMRYRYSEGRNQLTFSVSWSGPG